LGGLEHTPKQIGDALRSVSPADHEPGKAMPTIISDPDDVHVRIGDNPYSLKISVTAGQGGKLYPQIMLHHAAIAGQHPNPQWHVTMYPIDHAEMYVEGLYYGTELGAQLGPRITANQLFKFIADMGYTEVTLDDASSVQFLMPKISGPVVRHVAEPKGYSFEFVDIKAVPDQGENYFRSLSMNLVNTVKHVVLSGRPTLRHYSGAAASVRDQAGTGAAGISEGHRGGGGAVAAEIGEEPLEKAVGEEIKEVRSTGYAQSNDDEDDKEQLEQPAGGAAAKPFTITFSYLPDAPAKLSLSALVAAAQGDVAVVLQRVRAAAAAEPAAPGTPLPPRDTMEDAEAGGEGARAREAEAARAARREAARREAAREGQEGGGGGHLHASFFRLKF
jgi:hypothetical protein